MPVYDLAEWAALQKQIKAGGQMVSGMTPAEAQAALGTQTITTQGGSTLHIYNPGTVSTSQPPLQFPGADAPVDAYWEYVNQGGTTSAGGAATSGPSVINNSNATITKTATGATGIAGVLSMNLPTAAAAIAPIAGFAIGAGLYTLNPGLWEKISRALLPFCYPDTNLTPVVVDENGATYFQKDAIDAVKAVISEATAPGVTSDVPGIDAWSQPIKYYEGRIFRCSYYNSYEKQTHYLTIKTNKSVRFYSAIITDNQGISFCNIYCCRTESFQYGWNSGTDGFIDPPSINKYASSTTGYGGDEYYKQAFNVGITTPGYSNTVKIISIDSPVNVSLTSELTSANYQAIDYTVLHGDSVGEPVGLSKWSGSPYPASVEPLNVFTRYSDPDKINPEFLPFYPVTIPVGDPGVSVDPATTPDITVNPDPNPAINPWISPSPSPSTYPGDVPQSSPAQLPGNVPDYTPNLNPDSDPSQEPSPEPAPEPDPAPNENSSGTSPTPAIPVFPALPSAASSLLHVYNPTQGQIDSFGSWLWTTFSGDLIDTVSKLFNDPMDAVIGLHELYATPAVSGSSTIRAGFLDSGVTSKLVGSRYTSINCGSVVVPEYYQNYLDYSPYTKCFVYLPFVGIVPVSADDIIGNAVQIKYNVDSYTGCCIAIITVAREGYSSTVYQFEGNCGVEIPITSGYQSTLIGGLLGVAGTAISGSPHVGLAAASLGRANLGKNEVSHSGSFGSSYGAMGAKIPYIIVKRPTQKSVVNYNDEYGFPAHKRVRIGDCSGYLRAREVHVISPTATDEEKKRIEEMLKEGVFVK